MIEIKATKMTREEEKAMFEALGREDVSAAEKKRLKDHIVLSVYPLIVREVSRLGRTTVPTDDLLQAGMLGALRAFDKFDSSKDLRFSTYADAWIRDFIWKQLAKERTILSASGYRGGDSDAEKERRKVKVTYADARESDETADPFAQEPDDEAAKIDLTLDKKLLVFMVEKADLSPDESFVITNKYASDEDVSLAELGRRMDLCRERVRKIHVSALEKIREVAIAIGRLDG